MELKDKIPKILEHIERYRSVSEFNLRLFNIYEGQIKNEIEDSMRLEILSPAALKRALQRIPSINIIRKATDKLSTVYSEPVTRITDKDTDQDLMNDIIRFGDFNGAMMSANKMANLTKMAAIEPYVDSNKQQRFRVMAGHQFLPYGDNPMDPLEMTVFIKFMGTSIERTAAQVDVNGRVINEEQIIEVNIFALYSNDEIIVINDGGHIRTDIMKELGINGVNILGVIPQIYINKSKFKIVPNPDTSGLDISILIPKLLADTNYAVQFMSHSIIWTKDTDLEAASINPDSVINLGDSDREGGGSPEIGTIDPKVDIEGVLQLAQFQLSGYFASIGIKTSNIGSMMPGREASGISKAMDEGDTTAERKAQIETFRVIEYKIWSKMQILQKRWSEMGTVEDKRKFSEDFKKNLGIIFTDMKVIESTQDKVLRLTAQNELGIIDRKSMLQEFNPDFSEKQIKKRLEASKKEKDESVDEMMNMGNVLGGNDNGRDAPNSSNPSAKGIEKKSEAKDS